MNISEHTNRVLKVSCVARLLVYLLQIFELTTNIYLLQNLFIYIQTIFIYYYKTYYKLTTNIRILAHICTKSSVPVVKERIYVPICFYIGMYNANFQTSGNSPCKSQSAGVSWSRNEFSATPMHPSRII